MPRALLTRAAIWGLAIVSLGFGVWRSLQPEALQDFHSVMTWTAQLASGQSPWAPVSEADYPPWAIASLVPWLLVPEALRATLWIAMNVLVAGVLVWSVARAVPVPAGTASTFAGLLLAGGMFRVLSQFSLLSFALGWAGVRETSPTRGGLWLGLALMKPHIGGPLWLAHLLMGDWRRVGVAALVPIAMTGGVSAWLGMSPTELLADYYSAVVLAQTGVTAGHTELRPWMSLWTGAWPVLGVVATVALVALVPVVAVAARYPAGQWARPRRRLELYAACGLVSLLAVRHLSYDYLLLLPLLAAWRAWPGVPASPGAVQRGVWWGLTGWIVVQPTGWVRRLSALPGADGTLDWVLELDRVLCVVVFGVILWSLLRLDMTK